MADERFAAPHEEDVVIKRLRREQGPVYGPLCQEAADEIERQERALLPMGVTRKVTGNR
jgi:hypothetical protein